MDEDAMLTAIGVMSMDEARDKYADEWAEFCKKLTNWKSIHQLFRLGHLKGIIDTYTGYEKSFKEIAEWRKDYRAKIHSIVKKELSGIYPWEEKPESKFIIRKLDTIIDAATTMKGMGTLTQEASKVIFGREGIEGLRNLVKSNYDREKENKAFIKEARIKKLQLQDEYDITKPYAMGLLVADIFYSLSAAIEGDIY